VRKIQANNPLLSIEEAQICQDTNEATTATVNWQTTSITRQYDDVITQAAPDGSELADLPTTQTAGGEAQEQIESSGDSDIEELNYSDN